MPDTKEKVWLLLQFSILNRPLQSLQGNVDIICCDVRNRADLIPDLHERGKAYMYIGDFAAEHQSPNQALLMYYSAKENFYNCERDSLTN